MVLPRKSGYPNRSLCKARRKGFDFKRDRFLKLYVTRTVVLVKQHLLNKHCI